MIGLSCIFPFERGGLQKKRKDKENNSFFSFRVFVLVLIWFRLGFSLIRRKATLARTPERRPLSLFFCGRSWTWLSPRRCVSVWVCKCVCCDRHGYGSLCHLRGKSILLLLLLFSTCSSSSLRNGTGSFPWADDGDVVFHLGVSVIGCFQSLFLSFLGLFWVRFLKRWLESERRVFFFVFFWRAFPPPQFRATMSRLNEMSEKKSFPLSIPRSITNEKKTRQFSRNRWPAFPARPNHHFLVITWSDWLFIKVIRCW